MNIRVLLFTLIWPLLFGCNSAEPAPDPLDKTVHQVNITTEFGEMKVLLYNETPQHRDNFLKLIDEKFYDGLLFHRVMTDFMIQGGDPESKHAEPSQMLGMGENGYTIPAEMGKGVHKKGALSAARLSDQVNPEKASSGCQFFIVKGQKFEEDILTFFNQKNKYSESDLQAYQTLGGRPDLDNEYTVFGEVIEGLEVIDQIIALPVDENNRPFQNVTMQISRIHEK